MLNKLICHWKSLLREYALEEELIHIHLTYSYDEEVFPRPVCLGTAPAMTVTGNKIVASNSNSGELGCWGFTSTVTRLGGAGTRPPLPSHHPLLAPCGAPGSCQPASHICSCHADDFPAIASWGGARGCAKLSSDLDLRSRGPEDSELFWGSQVLPKHPQGRCRWWCLLLYLIRSPYPGPG